MKIKFAIPVAIGIILAWLYAVSFGLSMLNEADDASVATGVTVLLLLCGAAIWGFTWLGEKAIKMLEEKSGE